MRTTQLRIVDAIYFHLNSWIFYSPIFEVLFINETILMEMCFISHQALRGHRLGYMLGYSVSLVYGKGIRIPRGAA